MDSGGQTPPYSFSHTGRGRVSLPLNASVEEFRRTDFAPTEVILFHTFEFHPSFIILKLLFHCTETKVSSY